MNTQPDALAKILEDLRTEMRKVIEELRVIEARHPALLSRRERIRETLQILIGESSTDDAERLSMPRTAKGGFRENNKDDALPLLLGRNKRRLD